MGFKPNPNKKARLEDLSKAALIKTVRTLQRRETKLLNQVTKLVERLGEAQRLIASVAIGVDAPSDDGTYNIVREAYLGPELGVIDTVGPFPWEQK